jgi:hypothetical protein
VAATDLFDAAAELLAACETAVSTTPGGAISRTFVSPGLPALDCCPQLSVHVGGAAEGDTAPLSPPLQPGHRTTLSLVNLVQLTATVVRCTPVWGENEKQPPSAAEIQAAAELTNADLWAIWNVCREQHRAGTLFTAEARDRASSSSILPSR